MFAVIKSGGKQYKVFLGSILKLEKLENEKNSSVIFKEVLMIKNETSVELGTPFLSNTEVKAKVLENKKDKKVIIFKKRRRHNSRRKNGHRQHLSVVQIQEITINGKTFKDIKKKKDTEPKKDTDPDKITVASKELKNNKKEVEIKKNTKKKLK